LLGVQMTNKEYSVYAIESQVDSRIYIGLSSNVLKRLDEHNSGETKSTKGYRPWKLVYCEWVGTRVLARKREIFLKSGYGKGLLKKLIIDSPEEALNCKLSFGIENHSPLIIGIN